MAFTRTWNRSSTQQRRQQQPPPPQPPPQQQPSAAGGPVPSCRCPAPAVQRTVRKQGPNQGRVFFTCHRPMGQQCGFFEWATPAQASQQQNPNQEGHGAPSGSNNPQPSASGQGGHDQQQQQQQQQRQQPQQRPFFNQSQRNTSSPAPFPAHRNDAPSQSGAAPRPSPFAIRAQKASGGTPGAGNIDNAQQSKAVPVALPNGQLRLALADLNHLSAEVGPLLPRAACDSLFSFDGVKKRIDENGVQTLIVAVDSIAAFTKHAEREARIAVRVDPPDWVMRSMAAYRSAEALRERDGDVVTQPLDELLPDIVCEKLMEFQWHGVHFAMKHGGRCLIADDMGLGKTLQAIAIARVYMDDWPLLIVCPSSLRLNWKHELLQWLGDDLDEGDIRVIMSGKDINLSLKRVTIVSYDLARKIQPELVKRCQFIIADESHYLKSMSALRSKAVVPLLKNARRAILLSGTPALSRPVELYPQLHAVAPMLFPSYNDYVNRYCNAFRSRFGLNVAGSRNLPELHNLLTSSVLIRRRKDDVLKQLPEKRRQILWVETKSSVLAKLRSKRSQYDSMNASMDKLSEREALSADAKLKGLQNEMWQLSADAKIDSIMEVCRVTAESGVKFIVFAHHASVVSALCEFLMKKLKLDIIRIDGNTPQKDRQGLCRKFQEEEACKVAVLSITAAGVGLTLTKATVVVFAELYWNPGSLLQAEDRAHRIGQRDCVVIKYLLAKDTLDEQMWSMVRKKLTVVGKSLTGKAGHMDVKESGKDGGDEEAEDDGKGKSDIRNFFKRKAEKRARSGEQGQQGQQGTGNDPEQPIESQARNDEVVVIDDDDDDDIVPSVQTSVGTGEHRTGRGEVIELEAPTASYAPFSHEGEPGRKRARRQTAKATTGEDELAEMFPDTTGSSGAGQDAACGSTAETPVDDDVALARRLQAQYDREASAELARNLD